MNKILPFLLLSLFFFTSAGQAIAGSPGLTKLQWVQTMNLTPTPGIGCWTASFPNLSWLKVECSSYQPRPLNIGSRLYGDWNASSSPYAIVSSSGQFSYESGYTKEYDNGNGTENDNYYSLQLNTNTFSTILEGNGPTTGWEQFVFSNEGSPHYAGYVEIELWAVDWYAQHGHCPAYWYPDGTRMFPGPDCTRFTPAATFAYIDPGSLTSYILDGQVTSTIDTVKICNLSTGSCAASSASDALLGLYNSHWYNTEFNVFGYQDSSQANFNSGISLEVQTDNYQPTQSCLYGSYTGETSNLNLTPNTCQSGGNANYITFWEGY